ncbi:hypothetical protein BDW74DRAFT_182741 [Aspergillus multicolor]|uniref:uncharacterized protein n=1 Tax=Aspergillus multicolor TaxID=41759 RepID=UPI003CCC944C
MVDIDNPSIQPNPDNTNTEDDRRSSLAKRLAIRPYPAPRHAFLVKILIGKEHGFAKYRKGARFYFAGKRVHQVKSTVFYRHGQPSEHASGPPMVGYLQYEEVLAGRTRSYNTRRDPSGSPNQIVTRICEKRLAKVTLGDWTKDPYFACVLLALAQRQKRKWNLDLQSPTTYMYTSRLLVTSPDDHEYIYLYEAEIRHEGHKVAGDHAKKTPLQALRPLCGPPDGRAGGSSVLKGNNRHLDVNRCIKGTRHQATSPQL